jgi:Zn-dependent peptidase ImmA (M78 family)
MRNSHFKNRTANGHSLNKMNDETYTLRRKVIDIIYSLKNEVELPRIEVRIVSGGESSNCGYAYMGGRVVHINESHINKPHFYQVVLHEVLHAVLATEHDDNCDLMSPYVRPLTDAEALRIFKTYFKG